MKKIFLALLLFIQIAHAMIVPSPGVSSPVPRSMSLYPGEEGMLTIDVDNTKSEYDSFCSFSEEGGKSKFLMEFNPFRVEVEAGGTSRIDIKVKIPLDLAPGRYIERVCAKCGMSRAICASCQSSTVCDHVVDITVLKQSEPTIEGISFQLPEGVECCRDSDCASLVYCPDGTTFREQVCINYKCQEVIYADDPCARLMSFSVLEKISNFWQNFLESLF